MAQIRDVMTTNPTTVERSTTALEAAKVMAGEDVGPLPVTDGGRLVGIVTDRDIVTRVLAEERDPQSTTVGDICSSDLVTVTPEDDLDQALRKMASAQVRRLPVVEGDRIIGIVAQADVARQAPEQQTGEIVEEISR
jgi:CBS domain-containing protein